jgi:hypothetical protein
VTRISTGCLCVALALTAGCASVPWAKVPLDARSGLYEDATLTYRLDAGKLGQPLDVVRVEGQRVVYEQVASSPLPNESIGTLKILFPHPTGRAGYALARFTLDSAAASPAQKVQGWNPFAKESSIAPRTTIAGAQPQIHEAWELDIAEAELDQILKLLTNLGFYLNERPAGTAQLAVKMNAKEQTKPWDQVPALNLLVQRVRMQGQLVAYSRAGAAGAPVQAIVSTAAYQELLAQRGMATAASAVDPSAFALAPMYPPGPVIPPGPAGSPPVAAGLAQRPGLPPR